MSTLATRFYSSNVADFERWKPAKIIGRRRLKAGGFYLCSLDKQRAQS
jgi:hypothetical protein